MMDHLLLANETGNLIQRVAAGQADLTRLNGIAMALTTGKKFALTTGQYNYAAVILGGVADIRTSAETFLDVGRRTDVFAGMPYAVTIAPNTEFEIEALSDDFQFAACWATAVQPVQTRVIRPRDVNVHLHAVGRISYQVNRVVQGELSLWETYIPSTNWAFFPPIRYQDSEALLLMKQDRATGFALHQLRTDGHEETFTSRHNDVVIVPCGAYHSLVSSPIGVTYALGMSHSLSATRDAYPDYGWYRHVYAHAAPDPRLPIVDIGMEPIEPANHDDLTPHDDLK